MIKEVNEKIANWRGFTPREIADHALETTNRTMPITLLCTDEAHKAAVAKELKGRPGANLVELQTLDEHEASIRAKEQAIAAGAAMPEEPTAHEPEDFVPETGRKTRKRGRVEDRSTAHPDGPHRVNYADAPQKMVDEETGTERVRVSKRSKKMINPAFAPKKRGGNV